MPRILLPPRDLANSTLLKSAGTANNQTRLHQEPGETGVIVSAGGDASLGHPMAHAFQKRCMMVSSAGDSVYNVVPRLRRVSGLAYRREPGRPVVVRLLADTSQTDDT